MATAPCNGSEIHYMAFFLGSVFMTAEAILCEHQYVRQAYDVIVVGMGPVGLRFVQEFAVSASDASVAVFGDEPWAPYNRVKLSSFICGDIKEETLYNSYDIESYPGVTAFYNNRIVEIDRYANEVVDSDGRRYHYEHLVMATGSRAHVPVIEGVDVDNVYCFRDMNDAMSLMGRSVRTRKTIVIGGGLLGLEAAKAMQRFNTEVHVIEHDMWLMFKQLDERASLYLQGHIEESGIKVHTSQRVQKIIGEKTVEGVMLANGEIIECDTVILATGIIPNVQLALDTGLHIDKGIRVNNRLQTNDQNIYAIGECAEHNGMVYGLVAPGYEQAAVLAHHLQGKNSQYKGSISATRLKVVGLPVFSAGETGQLSERLDAYEYQDNKKNIYRKILLKNGRLLGALGTGEWPGLQRFQESVSTHRRIWPWQIRRFVSEGLLWNEVASENVIDWPATAIVCNCTGVTRGQLDVAMKNGAKTAGELMAETGASTVCGTCKDLVCDFAGGNAAREPVKAYKGLLLVSLIAFVAAITYLLSPSIGYTETAAVNWHIDEWWRDGFYKQVSGFLILGFSVFISFVSVRKRLAKYIKLWDFAYWRFAHVAIGVVLLGFLLAHTGLRMGSHLNFYLMLVFSALIVVGAVAGLAISYEHNMPARIAKRLRSYALWSHILLLWPLPGLLGFHVIKTYYF
jgi:nitrite reductase (NADH) large subunit